MNWVLGARDSVGRPTLCLREIKADRGPIKGICGYAPHSESRKSYFISHITLRNTQVMLLSVHMHTNTPMHTINDHACFRKPGGCIWTLDISHWPWDLVMQSPLIPTYDECMLEWKGGGKWWNRDTRAAAWEAVHFALRMSSNKNIWFLVQQKEVHMWDHVWESTAVPQWWWSILRPWRRKMNMLPQCRPAIHINLWTTFFPTEELEGQRCYSTS